MLVRSVLIAAVVALCTVGAVAQTSVEERNGALIHKARELELAMNALQQQAATSRDQVIKDEVAQLQRTNERLVDQLRQIAALRCKATEVDCTQKRSTLRGKSTRLSQLQQAATSALQQRANQSKPLADAVAKYLQKARETQVAIASAL